MVIEKIVEEIGKEVFGAAAGSVADDETIGQNKVGAIIGGVGVAGALVSLGLTAPIAAPFVLAAGLVGAKAGSRAEATTKQVGGAVGSVSIGTAKLISKTGIALGKGTTSLVGRTISGVVNFFKTNEDLLKDAQKLIKAQNYEQAEQLLNNILQEEPDFIEARLARASLYIKFNDSKLQSLAYSDFNRVLSLQTENTEALRGRAKASIYQGKYKEAVKDLTRAINLNSKDTESYFTRAAAYITLNQYGKAIDDYTTLLGLNPKFIHANFLRGCLFLEIEQFTLAVADFSIYLKEYPTDTEAYRNRAVAYLQSKQYKKALADYTKLIELEPRNIENLVLRCACFRLMENYESLLQDLNTILSLDSSLTEIYLDRAECLSAMSQYRKAMQDCKYVINLDSKNSKAHFIFGNIYLKQGKVKLAAHAFQKAVDLDPNNNVDSYIALAKIRFAQRDKKSAIDLINRAKEIAQNQKLTTRLYEIEELIQAIRSKQSNWSQFIRLSSKSHTQSNFNDEISLFNEFIKRHKVSIITILLLVFLMPIGVFFMWYSAPWPKSIKLTITGLASLILILAWS